VVDLGEQVAGANSLTFVNAIRVSCPWIWLRTTSVLYAMTVPIPRR